MKSFFKGILVSMAGFFSVPRNRRMAYLLTIAIIALAEIAFSGLIRRTFVFYSSLEGSAVVEERMLHRPAGRDREAEIGLYLREVLLGPVNPLLEPLFPRETRLISYMLRDGVVYADFSETAALPSPGTGDVFLSLLTLNEGIRRNFSHVRDVKIFIGGNEVFFNEFSRFFANFADNQKTSL